MKSGECICFPLPFSTHYSFQEFSVLLHRVEDRVKLRRLSRCSTTKKSITCFSKYMSVRAKLQLLPLKIFPLSVPKYTDIRSLIFKLKLSILEGGIFATEVKSRQNVKEYNLFFMMVGLEIT